MKAVVLRELGGPEKLLYEDVADPTPGAGEVIVKLKAAALNHRDQWIRHGLYAGIKLPIILGSDGAGVVHSVGAGVDSSLVGKAVVINPSLDWGDDERAQGRNYRILGLPDDGTYAELIKVPAKNALPKPEHLSWEEAAAIPLGGLTAFRAVTTRAQIQAGETALVTGIGGGVATFALKWATALGARTFVTSGNPAKLEQARQLGAVGGIDYRAEGWAKRLVELTGGLDVIVDGTGGPSFNAYFLALKPAGRLAVYGSTAGNPPAGLDLVRLFFRQARIIGSTMGSPDEFAAMMRFVAEHRIEPVIDRIFGLDEAVAAHQRLLAAEQLGKIVLRHG